MCSRYVLVTSLKKNAALLSPTAEREGRTVPSVPHELMLTLGYGHLQSLERGHGYIGISVAELALLFRQSWNALANDSIAVHPIVHGIAH